MGTLCVFCVYDTIGNRCFEKTSFPKIEILFLETYQTRSCSILSWLVITNRFSHFLKSVRSWVIIKIKIKKLNDDYNYLSLIL